MNNQLVYMGTIVPAWKSDFKIKTITFSVTDDCNLACTYCYFTHKTNRTKLSFSVAKKAVDWILSSDQVDEYDGVVWDFIGGEPTLEMKLIDEICDYILVKMYELNHKWLLCYRFMIGTNGLLYDSKEVQDFIKKHGHNVHVSITIDGNKQKHDLSRKHKDGSGSYDSVLKNVLLCEKQTGNYVTKSTFAHDDLPYLKDSIISLWEIGIKNVMANIVFENVWHDGDDTIFYNQLIELADYIIDNHLWDKYSVRFFDPTVGLPLNDSMLKSNYCGTGEMLAIGTDGSFYPCVRFMDSAMNGKKGLKIGNALTGINKNYLRAFKSMTIESLNTDECSKCEISTGCNWCSGYNYDESIHNSILERKKYNCKMHKANTEAARYFWHKLSKELNIASPRQQKLFELKSKDRKYLFIPVNEEKYFYCSNVIYNCGDAPIGDIDFVEAIDFCSKNDYIPVILGSLSHFCINPAIYYGRSYNELMGDISTFFLCLEDNEIASFCFDAPYRNVVIRIKKTSIDKLPDYISYILKSCKTVSNIHIQFEDNFDWSINDLVKYKTSLSKVVNDTLLDLWRSGRFVDIDVITYEVRSDKRQYCAAGHRSWTVVDDGKIYPCLAFARNPIENNFDYGNIKTGPKASLGIHSNVANSPLCKMCNATKCHICIYDNKKNVGEYLISSESNCAKSNIEHNISYYFKQKLIQNKIDLPFELNSKLYESTYLDPLTPIRGITDFEEKLKAVLDFKTN